MAKVRMYAPPARKVQKAYNKARWTKQRPINRAGLKDHGGTSATGPLAINSISPTTIPNASAPTTTITATGKGFVSGAVIKYKVGIAAEKTAATSTYISTTSYSFVIPAADLVTTGAISWTMTIPGQDALAGPNITRT